MSKTLNYIALGFFIAFSMLILILRTDRQECNLDNMDNETYKETNMDKEFLNLNVYQNVPPDNYNYLVNYPNGPWSWGEWSWGSEKGKTCNGTNYAVLEKLDKKENQRGINN